MRPFRVILRIGAVCCLLTSVLILAADAGEYPGWSRAGMRALVAGALPLLGLGVLNLLALDAVPPGHLRRLLTVLAVAGNSLLLRSGLQLLPPGGPPLGWILTSVAILLLVGSVAGVVGERDPEASCP
jgi:hypothetical protein